MDKLTPELMQFTADHADPICWTNSQGQILYVNEAACTLLGQEREKLLEKSFVDVASEMTVSLWQELCKEVKAQGTFSFEFEFQKAQQVTSVDSTAHYVKDARGQEWIGLFFRDVSESRRLKLIEQEFVGTVSHELRTPLTVIREGVTQVLEGLRGAITDSQKRALTLSLRGIDRLVRMINDLLDISKIESGKVTLHRETVEMVALAHEVAHSYEGMSKERGLTLSVVSTENEIEAYIDRDKMIQVLTNLVTNAIKFTPQGSVTIQLRVDDARWLCSVVDTGVGIAEEHLHKVFHKFEQFSENSKAEGGSGLGLSICKALVELHGGTIQVRSQVKHGTTFTFAIPRRNVRQSFFETVQPLLLAIEKSNATLSVAIFEWVGMRPSDDWTARSMQLDQLIYSVTDRKGNVLLYDRRAVYLAMPSTVRREAERVIEQIRRAMSDSGEASMAPAQVAIRLTCYPEDVVSATDFMQRIQAV